MTAVDPICRCRDRSPHLLLLGGGIVIKVGDEVVGAIGASGHWVATSTTAVPTPASQDQGSAEVAVSPSFAPPSNGAQATRYIFDQQVLVSRTTSKLQSGPVGPGH